MLILDIMIGVILSILTKWAYSLDDSLGDLSATVSNSLPSIQTGSLNEPVHVRYGSNVHYGQGIHGDHIAIRQGGLNIHFYADRVFVSPIGRVGGVEFELPQAYRAGVVELLSRMAPKTAKLIRKKEYDTAESLTHSRGSATVKKSKPLKELLAQYIERG